MKKTLVIFDIDGTLVYSNRVDSQCFAQTYQTIYGQPFPSIDWMRYPDVTDTVIFSSVIEEQFGREVEWEEVEAFQDQFVDLLGAMRISEPHHFNMVPNAKGLVDHLLDNDQFVVGIATGGWQRPAMLKLRHVEITTDPIIKSFADQKYTRNAIIQDVLDRAYASYDNIERVVYVGDQVWDVRTTKSMHMNLVGIRVKGDLDLLYQAGVEQVLENYRDVDRFLEAVAKAVPPR